MGCAVGLSEGLSWSSTYHLSKPPCGMEQAAPWTPHIKFYLRKWSVFLRIVFLFPFVERIILRTEYMIKIRLFLWTKFFSDAHKLPKTYIKKNCPKMKCKMRRPVGDAAAATTILELKGPLDYPQVSEFIKKFYWGDCFPRSA